jgi:hypothetical protein
MGTHAHTLTCLHANYTHTNTSTHRHIDTHESNTHKHARTCTHIITTRIQRALTHISKHRRGDAHTYAHARTHARTHTNTRKRTHYTLTLKSTRTYTHAHTHTQDVVQLLQTSLQSSVPSNQQQAAQKGAQPPSPASLQGAYSMLTLCLSAAASSAGTKVGAVLLSAITENQGIPLLLQHAKVRRCSISVEIQPNPAVKRWRHLYGWVAQGAAALNMLSPRQRAPTALHTYVSF